MSAAPGGPFKASSGLGASLSHRNELTYECKVKVAIAGTHEWTFVGPVAVLTDKTTKATVGKYYAGPTWEANDGSKVTGKQLAVSLGNAGSIPLQLVQAAPAIGTGAMTGVTCIQRVNTKGGVAPTDTCAAENVGAKKTVTYEADYLFYKAS